MISFTNMYDVEKQLHREGANLYANWHIK